jgi:hypothetical protein
MRQCGSSKTVAVSAGFHNIRHHLHLHLHHLYHLHHLQVRASVLNPEVQLDLLIEDNMNSYIKTKVKLL